MSRAEFGGRGEIEKKGKLSEVRVSYELTSLGSAAKVALLYACSALGKGWWSRGVTVQGTSTRVPQRGTPLTDH